MTTFELITSLQPKLNGSVTDFKYSSNGQYLAVADSQGYVQVYSKRDGKSYAKTSQFRAQMFTQLSDQGSVWSICWADSKYGNLIGIGSFRNKVSIFQESNNVWKEIAYHDLHHASVNWVQFSPYGLKLYAGSSDSHISILQLYHKAWKAHSFSVGDSAIAAFALQQFPLGEIVSEENAQKNYPRIATVTKDQKIKVWIHESEKMYSQSSEIFDKKQKSINKSGYILARQVLTPKQTIKSILWRPSWGTITDSLKTIPLLTCSQQGFLKSIQLDINSPENDKIKIILQEAQSQIIRISQSITGNILTASLAQKNQQETYIFQQIQYDEWKLIKKGKI